MSKCWLKIQTLPIFKKPKSVTRSEENSSCLPLTLHVADFQLERVGMHKNTTKQSKHSLSSWISSSNRSSYFKNLNSLSFTPWNPPELQTTSPVAAARGETTLACDVATPKVGRVCAADLSNCHRSQPHPAGVHSWRAPVKKFGKKTHPRWKLVKHSV